MSNSKKIILFDGACSLCNKAIQFVIKHDKKDIFRYAALQSKIGSQFTKECGIDTTKLDSIILIEPSIAYYTKSDAALQIGKNLKGYRTLSAFLLFFPKAIRNIVYDFVAHNRYKWYGKKESCMIPTPELQGKFLD